MAGFFQIILVATLIFACSAEPQRFRNSRFNRFSARQEEAPTEDATPAKAPYAAAGFKPDVPFELPTETTTLQPEIPLPDSSYGPPTTTYEPPTSTGINEAVTDVPVVVLEEADDDTESVISVAVSYDNAIAPEEPQRLVFGRRTRPLRTSEEAPQKLRAALVEPIILEDGSFVYSAPL